MACSGTAVLYFFNVMWTSEDEDDLFTSPHVVTTQKTNIYRFTVALIGTGCKYFGTYNFKWGKNISMISTRNCLTQSTDFHC
jgi:hypothetical protein